MAVKIDRGNHWPGNPSSKSTRRPYTNFESVDRERLSNEQPLHPSALSRFDVPRICRCIRNFDDVIVRQKVSLVSRSDIRSPIERGREARRGVESTESSLSSVGNSKGPSARARKKRGRERKEGKWNGNGFGLALRSPLPPLSMARAASGHVARSNSLPFPRTQHVGW